MEQSRPKRVKTSATRVRRREVGSPSTRDRAEQNFSFPHDMEAQGTIQFMELKGQVYPALVREFYANFRYKDGKYWSMISGNLFELNDEIFMNGQLTKAGSLSVENRLLHYIIAYILVQRNTNHAQPTVNDLRFMYAVKNNVMINWPEEILKIMNSDHLIGESLIHKMGIYKYGNTWQYQEDYTTIGLDLSDDDNQDDTGNQHATTQGEPSGSAPQNSAFGFDQLEAMEQRLNNRMDLHFQGLKDSYFAGMEQYEERQTAYSDNQFRELRNLIQSTAEAQNALFCSEFQKLSVLIRGDQNIVISADHTDDPHPPPQP
ncbi:hypothetical protein Lal_00035419 [Lupinus albus]|nr:hypothetical protein Lal_00035419 [Lupinus albus]